MTTEGVPVPTTAATKIYRQEWFEYIRYVGHEAARRDFPLQYEALYGERAKAQRAAQHTAATAATRAPQQAGASGSSGPAPVAVATRVAGVVPYTAEPAEAPTKNSDRKPERKRHSGDRGSDRERGEKRRRSPSKDKHRSDRRRSRDRRSKDRRASSRRRDDRRR